MKRKSCLLITLLLSATIFTSAQDLRLPRDAEKLVDRARQFWAAMAGSQRSKALEFILPEKRDVFLSGAPMPILKAKVLGIDLTGKPDEGVVRVSLDVFAKESGTGFFTWTVTDPWVWRHNNWFLDVQHPPDIFHRNSDESPIDVKEVRTKIEKSFQILRNPVDLGTLLDNQHMSMEVPIKYTGDLPLSLAMTFPNPLVGLQILSEPITSKTENFVLLVGTENWDGPFTLPLPLKITFGPVTVERTLVVKGNVFVPVTFRHSPPEWPPRAAEFSVFIRNNTDERARIHSVLVDGKMDLVKRPDEILPHEEVEVVFNPHPDETPDRLYLNLDTPIGGRTFFTYRFPNVPR